jgi:pimeloyl-ACP methyl ester carboxylesterase
MMKKFALFLILLLSFPCLNIFAQQPTYVIVHGAWGGSWQFKNTANELEKLGSKVYRVNLTGLGERYHLANADINLSTHIKDVVNTILFERLDSVILIGHSYGGMVVTGVADSIPEKLKKVIYLDAFLPENGESVAA